MKKAQISIVLIVVVFVSVGICIGQTKPNSPLGRTAKTQRSNISVQCQDNWHRVERDLVTFCVPTTFSVKEVISLDQSYLLVTGPALEINVFTGCRTPTLVSDSTLTGYTRDFRQIGEYPAVVVSYLEKDGERVRDVKIDFLDNNGLRRIALFSARFKSDASSGIFDEVLRTITILDQASEQCTRRAAP